MTKYIDAEKLKAEIEMRLVRYDPDYTSAGKELKELLTFVIRLQQEQPEESEKDCNDFPHCIDRKDQCKWRLKGGTYKGEFIVAEIDERTLKQEEPEVDLEKEIEKWFDIMGEAWEEGEWSTNDIRSTARHFYELGLKAKEGK